MHRSYQKIDRRKTRSIKVGNLSIGGESPILVQTMTNTLTSDVKSTVDQIRRVISVGADIVRVSIPDKESSNALKEICKKVEIPVIADIHFHYQRAIESARNGASCLRINPGNIGSKEKIREVIKAAKDYNCSIRIGVNGGSLEKKDNISIIIHESDQFVTSSSAVASLPVEQDAKMKKQQISLKFLNSTWIQLRDKNDKIIISKLMNPGDEYTYNLSDNLSLTAGNAGNIIISLDGKVKGKAGKGGEVVESLIIDSNFIN